MSEHEDDIVQFFARNDEPDNSEAFAAAVRRRVQRERLGSAMRVTAGVVALAAIPIAVAVLLPFGSLYPLRIAQDFFSTWTGLIACGLGALAIASWVHWSET